ncbi:hypothetical protein [Bacillus safensis]|uniref:hypothetical protein n=1 Tax=Bacillus safensis TaxID=561879 RepID=UPI0005ADB01A|nr:hypothetical protein [Bacillus safensis]KIL11147.1 hypothetical protein B4107_1761 [Bacillus safensis]
MNKLLATLILGLGFSGAALILSVLCYSSPNQNNLSWCLQLDQRALSQYSLSHA